MGFKEAIYYRKLADKKAHCILCPHSCFINNGETGKCIVRQNIDGNLKSMFYGKPHIMRHLPIESFGFYHVMPSKEALSLGIVGNNLVKKIEKNKAEIGGNKGRLDVEDLDKIPKLNQNPMQVIQELEKSKAEMMVYAHGEPIIFCEYIKDIISKSNPEIKHLIVSGGFAEKEAAREIISSIDGANIEIDSIGDEFYQKNYGIKIEPILEMIKMIHSEGKWLEITIKVHAGGYDEIYETRKLVSWIFNNLSNSVPLHLKFAEGGGDIDILKRARKSAMNAGMNYVYIDNLAADGENTTFCPNCKNPLIIRREARKARESKIIGGECSCGEKIPGIWQ